MVETQPQPDRDAEIHSARRGGRSVLEEEADAAPWSNPLVAAALASVAAEIAFAFTRPRVMETIAVSILSTCASMMGGALLGFLFGIPRAVQDTTPSATSDQHGGAVYRANTNLEQISDWLTKIIVGVGLIEIGQIPNRFMSLAGYVATAFGPPPVPGSLVAVGITSFALTGFLGSYLWTRLLLTLEFTRADRAARQSPAFYEGLVHALLYEPPPDGFAAAIENGEAYVRTYGAGNWRIWRSLACAHAQKFGYLSVDPSADKSVLESVRNKALDAVKRVLALNPREREGLCSLWDPERATPEEDDLTVFYDDPDFRQVLRCK